MYAALLGGVDGVRLISAGTAAAGDGRGGERRRSGLREFVLMGAGLLDRPSGTTAEETPTAFGMGGAGGSFAYGDTATGIAFGMAKNGSAPTSTRRPR